MENISYPMFAASVVIALLCFALLLVKGKQFRIETKIIISIVFVTSGIVALFAAANLFK